jgi:monovalent cation:H+ antiporter, CPA1 family
MAAKGICVDQFIATETLVIELLLVVSLVAIAVRRLRVPYTVALVVVGLLLTFSQPLQVELTPDLILALFVPPLVFEAAFHIEWRRLREALVPILVLAVPGVLVTALLVGFIVSAGVGVSLATGLLFGTLIAATDPVAVVALFRALGAPKTLTVLIEGESLFNDGSAIVLFNVVLAAALATARDTGAGSVAPDDVGAVVSGLVSFVRVAAGGMILGLGLGWVAAEVIARVDDYLIETTLTTVLAFGSFLIAERLHVSGVLAVVAAGILCGNVGLRGMSPTTRIVLLNFWEYLAFVANSLVFLLIGLEVNIPQLIDAAGPIAVGVVAVLASRALVIYALTWIVGWRRPGLVSRAYRHVLFWGGLRGAISLALVLSLPATFADRELLRVMTFGVVLFTLLAQGTTMSVLLRRLGLVAREEVTLEYERRHGRLMASRAAHERLAQLHRTGMISSATWGKLDRELSARTEAHLAAQQALLQERPALLAAELDDSRREGLRAERAMLSELLSSGTISETVYDDLVAEVDAVLASEETAGDAERPPTLVMEQERPIERAGVATSKREEDGEPRQ